MMIKDIDTLVTSEERNGLRDWASQQVLETGISNSLVTESGAWEPFAQREGRY